MYAWLDDALAQDGQVITASRRLARELRNAYDARQIVRGRQAWLTPRIRSWGDWLEAGAESAPGPVGRALRLHSHASDVLWERCLRAQTTDGPPPGMPGMARQARQSWSRLTDWCVPVDELRDYAGSRDERLFASAAIEYERMLEANGWLDDAGLAEYVAGQLQSGSIVAPRRIVYAGFDRLVPVAERVFAVLGDLGCSVESAPRPSESTRPGATSYPDQEAEFRAAGAWARHVLQADPKSSIAIVCSSLESDAGRTSRLVREGLAPGWQLAGSGHRNAVNVSYGRRLSEYPAVGIALLILRWVADGLTSADVSLLLRSKLMGSPDVDGRCRLELMLRRMPDRVWSPSSLHRAMSGREETPATVAWLDSVRALDATGREMRDDASPSAWAATIDELLRAAGWPGARPLDSEEFQLVNRWRTMLNQLSSLEVVAPAMRFTQAVRRLNSMAADTLYQPDTGPGIVQLLGVLEVAGMEFDAIWITGLDASRWPGIPGPAALVSRALQRRYGMPDCTPDDTLQFSRRVLRRLIGCSREAVLSWAETGDDAELSPSPLLDEITTRTLAPVQDPGWRARAFVGGGRSPVDDPPPPVEDGEIVAGGAYTVQRQATEPFTAFAFGRLRIGELEPIEAGFPARTRGNVIHRAMHLLYDDMPARSEISDWSADELARRIDRSLDAAIAHHSRHVDRMHRRLLLFEKERLARILTDFVALEGARAEFSVEAVEQDIDFERHGVSLHLRVDRIDRVADGSLLVIDYKTGAEKRLLTRDGNPADLQLVVYATALSDRVGGVALVNLDSRAISYRAAGGSIEWGPMDPGEWEEKLTSWTGLVDQALIQIAGGDARVNVSQSATDGRRLNILSRLEERKRGR